MKVTGVQRRDGNKDYYITHEGKNYTAVRRDDRFTCNGVTATLREIKEQIKHGSIPSDDLPGYSGVIEVEIPECETWACVHPCAHLVLCFDTPDTIPEEVMKTLDAWGWLDESGKPDTKRADRELARSQTLNTETV